MLSSVHGQISKSSITRIRAKGSGLVSCLSCVRQETRPDPQDFDPQDFLILLYIFFIVALKFRVHLFFVHFRQLIFLGILS